MTKLSRLFLVIGCLLVLLAVILRISSIPVIIVARPIRLVSLLVLANTSLLLAILFKK